MRNTMRPGAIVVLMFWLLTGLLSAPAMAFDMPCHGGMGEMTMSADVPMTMHGDHGTSIDKSAVQKPNGQSDIGQADKDMQRKVLACAVDCLNNIAAFIPDRVTDATAVVTGKAPTRLRATALTGRIIGPALEPPISAPV